ncbi:MAG: hypothetical protein IKP14_11110 [Clostridiales bacterium]|nr:hypothetical protein [Clostridiales bacterium]
MEKGAISKEFFIGRFLYLKDLLDNKIPNVRYTTMNGHDAVSFNAVNNKTGQTIRRRVTDKNPKWDKFSALAAQRAKYEEQMNKLLSLWKDNYRGSLEKLSQGYMLRPNTDNPYNTEFWKALTEGSNTYPKNKEYTHNGIIMRSILETEVADVLDRMGIEYKYDTMISVGGNKSISPDFAMKLPEFNRCGFAEAMGGLSNFGYMKDSVDKYGKYLNCGLYPNRDVAMIPGDNDYRPDQSTIMRMLAIVLDSLARQYVIRKSP